jgi:CRISPR-associated protein Csm5
MSNATNDIGTDYPLEIEVVSPLHIGSGAPDLVDDLDFVRGRQIYVIDVDRVLAALPADRLGQAEAATPLSRLLNADEYAQYARYALNDPTAGRERVPNIRPHIKDTRGQPYIPGSSLKGAIRTALAWAMLRGTPADVQVGRLERNPRFADAPLEAQLFGSGGTFLPPHQDLFRALAVADSRPADSVELAQVALHSLRDRGGKRELVSKGDRWSFFIEVVPQGATLETAVRLDDYLLDPQIIRRARLPQKQDWLRGWLTYCHAFSQAVIAHERNFYAQHGPAAAQRFYERLAAEAEATEQGRESLLQIAWGTGWNSKTVGTALDASTLESVRGRYRLGRRNYPVFPKSRRLIRAGAAPNVPLGWVRLRLTEPTAEAYVPETTVEPAPVKATAPPPQRDKPPTGQPQRIEDLEPGMVLEGRVDGIANFGAFVDIGVGRNGLVHISELKEGWVDNVRNVVQEGQQVRVRVLNVDLERNRIGLSMKGVEQP